MPIHAHEPSDWGMAAPTKSFTALERISTKVRPMVSQLALAASRVRGPAKYSYGGGGEGGGGEGGGEGSGGEGGGGEGGGGEGGEGGCGGADGGLW